MAAQSNIAKSHFSDAFFSKSSDGNPWSDTYFRARYNRKTTFPFTGKEKDSETGYCYFGARYYDSDLSGLFLSVDPMAGKYPSISPYAYCAWNPVKYVDPDGRVIDDYFSSDGKYLGKDNAETNNVRIIRESNWNHLSKDDNGQIDHEVGSISSMSFSVASTKGMSIEAQLSVYEHYNPMEYVVEAVPQEEKKTNYQGMLTKIGCSDKKNGTAVVNHLYVMLEENRSLNAFGEALCDNADEIVNTFVHERNHIRRALKVGYYKWAKMNSTKKGRRDVERSAISTQKAHVSWKGCRPGFKKGIDNYEKSL